MSKISINNDRATVTIAGKTKELEIAWSSGGHPSFALPQWVGVRVGVAGKKIWMQKLYICLNSRWAVGKTVPQYVIHAYSPLNTVAHKIPQITIVGWWEDITCNAKSKR